MTSVLGGILRGFVIFADRVIKGSKRFTLDYVARYVRHPPISKRRILGYDGRVVRFSYQASGQEVIKEMPTMEFIKSVLQHMSGRQFKTVRRFGLYARRAGAKYQKAVSALRPKKEETVSPFSWRKNLIRLSGKDPLVCSVCGNQMKLYEITYVDKFGFLKSIKVNQAVGEAIFENLLEKELQDDREIRYQVHLSEMSC